VTKLIEENAVQEKYVPPKIEIRYIWGLPEQILEKIPELQIRYEGNCACSCECSCSCMCSCLFNEQIGVQITELLKKDQDLANEAGTSLKQETMVLELHSSSDISGEELKKIQTDISCLCACSCMCNTSIFDPILRTVQKVDQHQQKED